MRVKGLNAWAKANHRCIKPTSLYETNSFMIQNWFIVIQNNEVLVVKMKL